MKISDLQKMRKELKPCPFCGETNIKSIIVRGREERYFINHFDAIFRIESSIGFDTVEEAIESWNRRADNGYL